MAKCNIHYKWSPVIPERCPGLLIIISRRKETCLVHKDPSKKKDSNIIIIFFSENEMQKLPFALKSWLILLSQYLSKITAIWIFKYCIRTESLMTMMGRIIGSDQTIEYKNISNKGTRWVLNWQILSCLCGQSAFMDLVDVFAVPSDQPPSDLRWKASHRAAARPGGTDPWDSLGKPYVHLPWAKQECLSTKLNIICRKVLCKK